MYTGTAGSGLMLDRERATVERLGRAAADVYLGNRGQPYHGTTQWERIPVDGSIAEYHVNNPATHMKYPPHLRTQRQQAGCICGPTSFITDLVPETILGFPYPVAGNLMRIANCELAPMPIQNLQLGVWVLNYETIHAECFHGFHS